MRVEVTNPWFYGAVHADRQIYPADKGSLLLLIIDR